MRDRDDVAAFEVFIAGEAWTQIAFLPGAGPDDKVFALNREDGTLVFGDGVHGKRPPTGANVTVSYADGGAAGNVGLSITGRWPFLTRTYLVGLTDRGCQIRPVESIGECCSGEKRPRYFSGQLLTASDFEAEQNYFLQKIRRHNRLLHGTGVVTGLEISVTGGADSSSVVISPGYAIDPEGRELIVREPISLCIPDRPSPQFVSLRYSEREMDPVPLADEDRDVLSRIEDCVLVWILPQPEQSDALTVGRLLQGTQGWEVDAAYQPQRSH